MWLFDLFFLNSANLICRSTDILKYFRESVGIRDNESRLYDIVCVILDVTCQQLGYINGLPLCCSPYGYRKTKEFMDNVKCVGNERRLTDCKHNVPHGNVCSLDYAAVACYNGSLPKGMVICL